MMCKNGEEDNKYSGGSCAILHYSRARTNKNSAVPYCNGKKCVVR